MFPTLKCVGKGKLLSWMMAAAMRHKRKDPKEGGGLKLERAAIGQANSLALTLSGVYPWPVHRLAAVSGYLKPIKHCRSTVGTGRAWGSRLTWTTNVNVHESTRVEQSPLSRKQSEQESVLNWRNKGIARPVERYSHTHGLVSFGHHPIMSMSLEQFERR